MRERKGFTLIELLAVIVILAVIALIALPIILGMVEDAKEKANENSAYGILDSANYYFTNSMLKESDIEYDTNIIEELTYDGGKPNEGSEVYVNEQGRVAVALLYGDKCYKKEYADEKISLGDTDNCVIDIVGDPSIVTIKKMIQAIPLVTSGSGLYKVGEEYRYRGGCDLKGSQGKYSCSNVDPIKNYVSIDGQLYRVILMDRQGVKVITQDSVVSMTFDTFENRNNDQNTFCQVASGNSYYGCNVYAAPVVGIFSNEFKEGTVTQNSILYDYLNMSGTEAAVTTLRNVARNASWNIGTVTKGNAKVDVVQVQEASQKAKFKLGLMNASDYILGSLDSKCHGAPVGQSSTNAWHCRNQNWLYNPSIPYVWVLNGVTSGSAGSIWYIFTSYGHLYWNTASSNAGVRVAAYINANTEVTGGSGTASDPWVLKK